MYSWKEEISVLVQTLTSQLIDPIQTTNLLLCQTQTSKSYTRIRKELAGRVLTDGEFSFKLTEEKSTPDKHERNCYKQNGKVTFSELSFSNPGTYKYKITELKVLMQTLTTMR